MVQAQQSFRDKLRKVKDIVLSNKHFLLFHVDFSEMSLRKIASKQKQQIRLKMQGTIESLMLIHGIQLVEQKFKSVRFQISDTGAFDLCQELKKEHDEEKFLERETSLSEISEVEEIHGSGRFMKKMTKQMSRDFTQKLNTFSVSYFST